ncbi:short-chain collagen C4-like [Mercenaria mercenaria]|uniref:short-chain collagen C4-like n=1 Tax=Mercenaria mercenaria TaxID=6596 RepID=UPI00234E4C4C|nr:short-chain collagen C4-like [Mercenaria mercenaria]
MLLVDVQVLMVCCISDDIFAEFQKVRQEIQALKSEKDQDIQVLKTENAILTSTKNQLTKGSGSVYTRWGRTSCDGNGTEKVYSGYTSGNPYELAGGAASYLCLPEKPTWAKYVDDLQNEGAYISGTEYQSNYFHEFDPFPQSMLDQDAPCAVCRSPRTTSIMIPGKTDCYTGWTIEYTGYLMSGYHRHQAATDYACVDIRPEATFHGEANQDGKLLFFVEVKCGSLPCQEYPNDRELACVVCSK